MNTEVIGNNFDESNSLDEKLKSQEKQNEAIKQENDRLFGTLDTFNLEQIHTLVDNLNATNPEFKKGFESFQDINSLRFTEMLKATANNKEVKEVKEVEEKTNNIFDYFGIKDQKLDKLNNELSEIGLDISELFKGYKNYIENNLKGLTPEQIDKVKLSINTKVLKLVDKIEELKTELDEGENFENNKWIINEELIDELGFINKELLPSLETYLKIKSGVDIPKKYTDRYEYSNKYSRGVGLNPNYIDFNYKTGEIEELLNSKIDSDGDFDEGFFSTQNVFDFDSKVENNLLKDLGINHVELNLLNDKDKKIESDAMISYFILIGLQMVPYIGAPIAVGVDVVDTFTSNDATCELGQKLGMIDKNFKMSKQWYDNVLGGVGLALTGVGLQGIARGEKITSSVNSLRKIGFGRVEEALQNFGGVLGITNERLNAVIDFFKNLFEGNVDKIKNIDNASKIDKLKYVYESPVNKITELIKNGNLENAKELLTSNKSRLRIFGDDIDTFDEYIREGNIEDALKLFKENEKRTIEDLKKIGFSIEDNEKFYKSLQEGNVDEIKRLLELSKDRLKATTKLKTIEDTYTKYGMVWKNNKTEIVNTEAFTKKEKMINSFTKDKLSRKGLHDFIITHFTKEIQSREKPSIVVFGGISGSGKSSIMKNEKLSDNYIDVNPDEIKRFLPEFDENNAEAVSLVHNESTHIGDKIFELAIDGKSDIIIENTMSYLPSIENYLQIDNYDKNLIFVFSGAESWKRNTIDRERIVNPEGFLNQFKAFENVIRLMKNDEVKNLKIVLNAGNEGEEILIYEKINGELIFSENSELKELENFAKIAENL